MNEWWSYRPEDFLLFSERVYWRLFEIHNQALWPAQFVAMAFGAAIVVAVFRPRAWTNRFTALVMAAAWLFVAWAYHWNAYAAINWTARYAALSFAAESALFIWYGGIRNQLVFAMQKNPRSLLRIGLIVYAVFVHPLMAMVAGRSMTSAEVFAMTPDPTAIATLGLLGLSGGGRGVLVLFVIPIAWCLVSAATLGTLGTWEGWIPLAAVAFALVTRPWRRTTVASS